MTTSRFAFQPWHSAVEFKRYLHRFIQEFPRINSLAGVDRTPYNPYDSIILPIEAYLKSQGVEFLYGSVFFFRPEDFTELTISRHQSQFSLLLRWLCHHRLRNPPRFNKDWCYRPHSRRSPRPRLPHPRLNGSLLLARHQHDAPQTPPRRRRGFDRPRRSLAAVVIPRKPFS